MVNSRTRPSGSCTGAPAISTMLDEPSAWSTRSVMGSTSSTSSMAAAMRSMV